MVTESEQAERTFTKTGWKNVVSDFTGGKSQQILSAPS